MEPCTHCGEDVMRSHRNAFERIFFGEKFRCRNCRRRRWHLWPEFTDWLRYIIPGRRSRSTVPKNE